MVVFDDLPAEIRNQIYEIVARSKKDKISICSKSLRGGCFVYSPFINVFASRLSKEEFRGVITRQALEDPLVIIEANVVDFKFTALTKYLAQQNQAGRLNRFFTPDAPNTIRLYMRFSRAFDGTIAGADKFVRSVGRLTKKHNRTLSIAYDVKDVHFTPAWVKAFESMPCITTFANTQSEWIHLVGEIRRSLSESGTRLLEGGKREEKPLAPGNDEWAKDLMGDRYDDIDWYQPEGLEEAKAMMAQMEREAAGS